MRKTKKTTASPSASTLMRRALTAKPREAKRLRAEAAELRKGKRNISILSPQEEAAVIKAVRKDWDAARKTLISGVPLWKNPDFTPDEAANDTPTPEQVAWERGRTEGRSEMRIEARDVRIRDFIDIVDGSRNQPGRHVHYMTQSLAEALVEVLWAAGYGARP